MAIKVLKDKRISPRITEDAYNEIYRVAADSGLTPSEVTRNFIDYAIAHQRRGEGSGQNV